jgi:hypothetical protein
MRHVGINAEERMARACHLKVDAGFRRHAQTKTERAFGVASIDRVA